MASYDQMLCKLDEKAFLGFKVWDFSFRSLSHRYGTAFLQDIVLQHPLRTCVGLVHYRRLVRGDYSTESGITRLSLIPDKDFQRSVALAKGAFLLAVGFCQKPMTDAGHKNGCPAGRFNHRCLFMESDLSEPRDIPTACQGCHIKTLATEALLAGVNMYIMTSAMDILRDMFVPSLQQRRFVSGIFCVCPYSVHPIAVPLLICGIKGFVVQFSGGYCADYSQWSLADRGIKNERTFTSLEAQNRILDVLHGVAKVRAPLEKIAYHRFRQEGNIYVPE